MSHLRRHHSIGVQDILESSQTKDTEPHLDLPIEAEPPQVCYPWDPHAITSSFGDPYVP